MSQAQIDGQITTAIDANQLAALKEYQAAAQEVTANGANANNVDIRAKALA